MSFKRLSLILLFSVIQIVVCFGQSEGFREKIDINGLWKFHVDSNTVGESSGWYKPSWDKSFWSQVTVPVAFDNCHPGLDRYSGTGWFAKELVIPESFHGRRIVLHFEGLNYNAKIWVNGKLVGENEDPFLPFEIPITEVAKIGGKNDIVVSINNIRKLGQFPLFEGWFGQGGFLREASLLATDHVYISKTRLTAQADVKRRSEKTGGSLEFEATVQSGGKESQDIAVEVVVKDKNDNKLKALTSEVSVIKPGSVAAFKLEGEIQNVKWWSPESPELYWLEITVLQNKRVVDKVRLRTGFRTVETKNAKIYLNGEEIFLKGFNRHEDSPIKGMASDLKQAQEDLEQIKRIGGNYVRLCHYPHHPGELDLCDELGLLVLAENAMNEWGHIDHPAPNPAIPLSPEDAPLIVENAKRTLTKMINRDNHHPSIIIWSVSNENEEMRRDVSMGNNELVRFGKNLEPSRLWTHVSNSYKYTDNIKDFYPFDDLIVVNVYPTHWYKPTPQDYDEGLPKSTQIMRDTLKKIHDQFPNKAIVIGEYGYPNGFNSPEAARRQAIATEAEFKGLDAPYVAGGAFWVYARHPWPWNNNPMSTYGYVSRNRMVFFPAFYVVERLYKEYKRK